MLQEIFLDFTDKKKMLRIARALANEARINILELLNVRSLSVNEIAEQLNLPANTKKWEGSASSAQRSSLETVLSR